MLGRPRLHLRETSSTNDRARELAAGGAPHGTLVTTAAQSAGRGRQGRTWSAPPGHALLMSLVVRDPPPLLPLVAAVAVAGAAGEHARIKWPNDVLVDGRKLAGILVERTADGAVVVGVGVNVSTRADELPVPTGTSIQMAGGASDRESLAKEILRAFERRYVAFIGDAGAPESVLPAYREVCETIGREVEVQLPDGASVRGVAVTVDDGGMLVVREADGAERTWSAGDVVYVRAER